MNILSVLFFIPFCRFRGNNRFGGERFPTEEVVIVFSCCVTSIVWKSYQPLSICSTLKHGTFYTKILAFFLLHFFLSQQTSQTSLFLIAYHHQKQFSHSISRPNQLPKEKPNDNNPNNFSSIKLPRKKRTDVALLLSDANRTFHPASLNSSPGANCQICLLFTERYQSQNPKAFKMHPQPNKIN